VFGTPDRPWLPDFATGIAALHGISPASETRAGPTD